jgi:hypothetical protein
MTKLRVTVSFEYEADPEWYPTSDPTEMAKIDLDNFVDDPGLLFEFMDTRDLTQHITVEPVE